MVLCVISSGFVPKQFPDIRLEAGGSFRVGAPSVIVARLSKLMAAESSRCPQLILHQYFLAHIKIEPIWTLLDI